MYRIIEDNYAGYEVQKKILCFWIECSNNGLSSNTHTSVEKAEAFIEYHKKKKIKKKRSVIGYYK